MQMKLARNATVQEQERFAYITSDVEKAEMLRDFQDEIRLLEREINEKDTAIEKLECKLSKWEEGLQGLLI